MSLTLFLNGARGRMGQAVIRAAPEAGCSIGAAVDLGDPIPAGLGNCDVIVDFSTPAASAGLIRLAVENRKPIVIGTTGHDPEEKKNLLAAAGRVPCVWAGNFSVGVNVLFHLTQRAAHILDGGYDAEVVEMHHRFKADAPSGTAARLVEIILQERKLTAEALRYGRKGITGARPPQEVGVHSLRGGDVVGDHTVIFAALGERIELTHRTSDRAILARGALRAAAWVVSQPAGVFDMQDVLGLRD